MLNTVCWMTFRHGADGAVSSVCVNGTTRLRRRRGESVESLEVRALNVAQVGHRDHGQGAGRHGGRVGRAPDGGAAAHRR
jgi:hypothetical protein